jgi:hypothetical protein
MCTHFNRDYLMIFSKMNLKVTNNNNSVALVRKRTIPAERPQFVGEVSANFCG